MLIGVSRFTDPNFPEVPAALNSLEGMRALLSDPLLCAWPEDRITVIADPVSAAEVLTDLRRLASALAVSIDDVVAWLTPAPAPSLAPSSRSDAQQETATQPSF